MKAILGNAQPWIKEARESKSWGAEKSTEAPRKHATDKETNSIFLVRRMPHIFAPQSQFLYVSVPLHLSVSSFPSLLCFS